MTIEPENRRPKSDDPWLRVPASARPAERHRFNDVVADELDESDEEIAFLKTLAEQAAKDAKPKAVAPIVPPRKFNVPADVNLELFRAIEIERPRPRVLNQMEVDLVEMDDLLEQLSTTAAALRRRKAA